MLNNLREVKDLVGWIHQSLYLRAREDKISRGVWYQERLLPRLRAISEEMSWLIAFSQGVIPGSTPHTSDKHTRPPE